MRRNQEMLSKIGVGAAIEKLRRQGTSAQSTRAGRPVEEGGDHGATTCRIKRSRGEVQPMRRSGRLVGAAAAVAITDVGA